MPALKNPRHERFAQELAKGKSQTDAYTEAGYKGDVTAASRLSRNVKVQQRAAELKERAATRAEITVADITDRLLKIAEKGEKSDDAPMLSVARASLMDAAKLNGWVVEKGDHQHKHVGLSVTYVTSPGEAPAPSPEDYETGA